MYKTYSIGLESAAKPLHVDLNRENTQVVVASSAVFKIFDILEENFVERLNLRSAKGVNLNYSSNDVAWSKLDPSLMATAATNGAVVIWNIQKPSRSKQEQVFSEHKRAVNKVNFHPTDPSFLLSGSQDGTMKLFDLRNEFCAANFLSNTQSVRDVKFCPHGQGNTFAGKYEILQLSIMIKIVVSIAVLESGEVQIWDARKPSVYVKKWAAHSDHIFTVDWHPESRCTLATAGRDKKVKVWNTNKAKLEYSIQSIGPVGTIRWRPQHKFQIAR